MESNISSFGTCFIESVVITLMVEHIISNEWSKKVVSWMLLIPLIGPLRSFRQIWRNTQPFHSIERMPQSCNDTNFSNIILSVSCKECFPAVVRELSESGRWHSGWCKEIGLTGKKMWAFHFYVDFWISARCTMVTLLLERNISFSLFFLRRET